MKSILDKIMSESTPTPRTELHDRFEEAAGLGEYMDDAACWQKVAGDLCGALAEKEREVERLRKDAERYEIAAADERKLREDAEKMLPWWRDRFGDLVDDAETLLGYAPKECHAALLGIKEVAAQSRNSIDAALSAAKECHE